MDIITDNIRQVIENNPVALATVMRDGRPNVIGVAYVKVVDPQTLLITDNYMSQTKEDILNNPNVALVVWDKKWHGYKFIGQAQYFSSGRWLEMIKKIPENKGLPVKGAILINVEKIIKSR